jgi:hypothetical protein
VTFRPCSQRGSVRFWQIKRSREQIDHTQPAPVRAVLTDKVVDCVDVSHSGPVVLEVAGALVAKQVGILADPNELSFHVPPAPVGRVQKPGDFGVPGLAAKRNSQKLTDRLRQFY